MGTKPLAKIKNGFLNFFFPASITLFMMISVSGLGGFLRGSGSS